MSLFRTITTRHHIYEFFDGDKFIERIENITEEDAEQRKQEIIDDAKNENEDHTNIRYEYYFEDLEDSEIPDDAYEMLMDK